MKLSFPLLAILLLGCPSNVTPSPHPVVEVDGDYPADGIPPEEFPEDSPMGLSSPCGKACDNLRKIPCVEGYPKNGVSCYRGCVSMARYQKIPTVCWMTARTQAEARGCGGIRCLTP